MNNKLFIDGLPFTEYKRQFCLMMYAQWNLPLSLRYSSKQDIQDAIVDIVLKNHKLANNGVPDTQAVIGDDSISDGGGSWGGRRGRSF